MNAYAGAMLLTVGANVAYHLCQRSIDRNTNPLASLIITYAIALIAALVAWLLFPVPSPAPLSTQLRSANWASYACGLSILGLELGFLLAYRAGWKVGVAALYSNAAVTVLLVPAGFLFFSERLDARKAVGLVLAGAGLWLLGRP